MGELLQKCYNSVKILLKLDFIKEYGNKYD